MKDGESDGESNRKRELESRLMQDGQTLYLLIHTTHPSLAAEITGMLVELLPMLESPQTLPAKVEDASAVYEAHVVQAKTPAPMA
ncbi:unnamed protein product [Coregonus sp. 'balchen']|nr:unnamed protein product [Coregonus sp. 'balchen']